jgi:thiol-disulfide isomerase/thioredoxin
MKHMQKRLISYVLLAASTASSAIIKDVRDAIARSDFRDAASQIDVYQNTRGITSELLEAMSWVARGALAVKDLNSAASWAEKTYRLSVAELKKRPLDQDRYLPIALGAAIEVQGQVLASRGERSAAVSYLRQELTKYSSTSIRTRIQKNINLLSLEGKPAPEISVREYAGARPPSLASLRGKPVLIFFWAHWCGDCKAEVATLAQVRSVYGDRVALLAPTQRYGYVAQGAEAAPDVEAKYIDEIRAKYYEPRLPGFPVPISENAFRSYGASTTPTLVLVDGHGVVRMYHPGKMSWEELRRVLERVVAPQS